MTGPVAIIQARMGSTRLPGKTLADIAGKPMLWHVVQRVRRAKEIVRIIIATTNNGQDDLIAEWALAEGLDCYRGSEHDVLDRYYQAARTLSADTIVRVTPDCPLLDPPVIDRVVQEYLQGSCDYASNTLTYTYPEGLDVEVLSFQALEKAWQEATKPSEREHVTPYIRNHPDLFRIRDVRGPYQCGAFHWSVDEPADMEFVRAVYRHLYREGAVFGLEEVLALLKIHPDLASLNPGAEINTGYQKSLQDEAAAEGMPSLKRSLEYLARAERVIPGASQTFSKSWTQFSRGVNPVFADEAQECILVDVDGNRYIDYSMGLCPVILGYNHPVVNEAVIAQLRKGISFSLPHRLEIELAEELVRLVPCAEMVRFGKNGSDATSAAVRVARAYTGRDHVVSCGYHGWQDWYIGTTTRSGGVPKSVRELTHTMPYNDLPALEGLLELHRGEIAAVIMEPVGVVPPAPGYLEGVRDLAHRHGALLIFDEIVTGFRMHLGGAQAYFGVAPDLAAFGKSMGNGMPIAAVVGRRDLMAVFNDIFFSATFGGETLSLAASLATIRYLETHNVINTLWRRGAKLKEGVERLIQEFDLQDMLEIQGYPVRTVVNCLDGRGCDPWVVKSFIQQESAPRGLLFSGSHNMSWAHTEEIIERTLQIYRDVFVLVAGAARPGEDLRSRLRGQVVQPVFRKA
jgi:glutamate-1-semialdehyde 2,1-aminomutase/spore coat polysaccharide biosynthesis protein SpsF